MKRSAFDRACFNEWKERQLEVVEKLDKVDIWVNEERKRLGLPSMEEWLGHSTCSVSEEENENDLFYGSGSEIEDSDDEEPGVKYFRAGDRRFSKVNEDEEETEDDDCEDSQAITALLVPQKTKNLKIHRSEGNIYQFHLEKGMKEIDNRQALDELLRKERYVSLRHHNFTFSLDEAFDLIVTLKDNTSQITVKFDSKSRGYTNLKKETKGANIQCKLSVYSE